MSASAEDAAKDLLGLNLSNLQIGTDGDGLLKPVKLRGGSSKKGKKEDGEEICFSVLCSV